MIKAMMVVTYLGGALDGFVTVIPFADPDACGAAMMDVEAMVQHAAPDVMLQCQPVVVRPKRNPIYGEAGE